MYSKSPNTRKSHFRDHITSDMISKMTLPSIWTLTVQFLFYSLDNEG